MKTFLALLLSGAVASVSASQLLTNYLSFSIKWTPESSGAVGITGTNLAPGYLAISYRSNEWTNNWRTLEFANNSAAVDLSSDIAGTSIYVTTAIPLWNSFCAGTNQPLMGTLDLEGVTFGNQEFELHEPYYGWGNNRHWMTWAISFDTGDGGYTVNTILGGSGFSDIANQFADLKANDASFWPLGWGVSDALNVRKARAGAFAPANMKHGWKQVLWDMVEPYEVKPDFVNPPTNAVVLVATNLNSGLEGFMFHEMANTNACGFFMWTGPNGL